MDKINLTNLIEINAQEVLTLVKRIQKVSFSNMLTMLNLNASDVYLALGWLANEQLVDLQYVENNFIIQKA